MTEDYRWKAAKTIKNGYASSCQKEMFDTRQIHVSLHCCILRMYAKLFEIIAGGFNSSVLLDQLHLEKCRQGNLVALKKIPDVAFYDLVESK